MSSGPLKTDEPRIMSSPEKPKSVLIVEDEKIVAIDIRNQVENLGYSVAKVVPSGEAALEAADGYSLDLVLMDIQLAGNLDGFETAKLLRERQDVPVVFLSAYSDEGFVVSAKEAGAFGYVVKPPRGRELAIGMELALYKHEGEKHLKLERDRAERAMAAKSEFLSNMSHELRTPLNSIIGMAELALDRASDSEQRSYLSILKSSGDGLLALINGILDLSKMEAGMMEIAEEPFDPLNVIEGSVEALATEGHKKGLSVDFYADPRLPPLLLGDAGRLRQVLLNLIGNAVKYTDAGSVFCGASVDHETLRILVSDTGVGVPEELKEQIFAPFYQVDQTSTKKRAGTGIGLTITKRLVTMMGGSIGFESTPGKGSAFELILPIRVPPGALPETAPTPLSDDKGLRRIALGLDREVPRRLASEWLRAWGIESSELSTPVTQGAVAGYNGDSAIVVGEESADALRDHHNVWVLRRFDGRASGSHAGKNLFEPLTVTKLRRLVSDGFGSEPNTSPSEPAPQESTASEPAPSVEAVAVSPKTGDGHLGKVLLADDNAINRLANSRLLGSLGYKVTTVDDGQEAIEALEAPGREIPDLIILDLEMPRLDGYGAAASISSGHQGEEAAATPIVALSAHTSQEARARAFRNGFCAYLVKPFSLEELETTLSNVRDPAWRRDNLARHFVQESRVSLEASGWSELENAAQCGRRALKKLDPELGNWFLRLLLAARRKDKTSTKTLIEEIEDYALTRC